MRVRREARMLRSKQWVALPSGRLSGTRPANPKAPSKRQGGASAAGTGENSAPMRARIGERLAWLGITLDQTANTEGKTVISRPDSRVAVYVVPTNEELMIARHTLSLLSARKTPENSRSVAGLANAVSR